MSELKEGKDSKMNQGLMAVECGPGCGFMSGFMIRSPTTKKG